MTARVCVCGHVYNLHLGGTACLSGAGGATACPCRSFRTDGPTTFVAVVGTPVLFDFGRVSAGATVRRDADVRSAMCLGHYQSRGVRDCGCIEHQQTWVECSKQHQAAARLADRHYSRRTPGSRQFMPPGQTLVLLNEALNAVFGWHRPHPDSQIVAMNGLDGWTCTIFRNESRALSSDLILAAERMLSERFTCGPDGLLTYVYDNKVASENPGYCFKKAGWGVHPTRPRSADNKKTLLHKPFIFAGMS